MNIIGRKSWDSRKASMQRAFLYFQFQLMWIMFQFLLMYKSKARCIAPLVKCLSSTHESLGSIPAFIERGVVVRACNPSCLEVEAEGSEVKVHPMVPRKFGASLHCWRHSFFFLSKKETFTKANTKQPQELRTTARGLCVLLVVGY